MKGLLLKELFNLRQSGRSLVLIVLFYTVFFGSMEGSFLGGIIVIMVTMFAISTFSYDELAKWDIYALSLPITRQQLVLSKYILSFAFILGGALLGFGISALVAVIKGQFIVTELLVSVLAVSFVAIYMIIFILPLIYKYGVERGRLYIFVTTAIPFLLVMGLYYLGVPMPSPQALEESIKTAFMIIPILLIIGTFISYRLSVKLLQKKEY